MGQFWVNFGSILGNSSKIRRIFVHCKLSIHKICQNQHLFSDIKSVRISIYSVISVPLAAILIPPRNSATNFPDSIPSINFSSILSVTVFRRFWTPLRTNLRVVRFLCSYSQSSWALSQPLIELKKRQVPRYFRGDCELKKMKNVGVSA